MQPLLDEKRLGALVHTWARESGRRVQQRRMALNLTQTALAKAVQRRPQTISKIELGEIVPKPGLQWEIAATLLCEVDELWPAPDRSYIVGVARTEVPA